MATVGVPVPFFGNVCEHLFLRKSYGKVIFEWYSRFKGERFVGFYVSSKPFLLVTDPSLAKEIMVDRFDKFSDRGHIRTKEIDPLSENLITLHGRQWTESRRAVQPALNSAKLRPILPVWNGCCGGLADGFRSDYDGGRPSAVSLRLQHSLLEMFVTSCLGITYESFLKNSLLKQISEELINPTRLTSVRTLMMFVCPRLINFLGWRRFSNDKIDYLRNFYKELYRLRKERNGGDRPDLFLTLTEVHRSENIKQLFRGKSFFNSCKAEKPSRSPLGFTGETIFFSTSQSGSGRRFLVFPPLSPLSFPLLRNYDYSSVFLRLFNSLLSANPPKFYLLFTASADS